MDVIESAAAYAQNIAADDSHGYDQAGRWGPDYDCSSLVISAFRKAGGSAQLHIYGKYARGYAEVRLRGRDGQSRP